MIKNGVSKLDKNENLNSAVLEIVLDSIIFVLIGLKMFTFFCCGQRVSFGQTVIWVFVEFFLVLALTLINIRNWALTLSGILLCLGSSGTYLLWGTLKKQMQLACLGLTLKEQHSRYQSTKLEFSHDPREDISTSTKCSNFWSFWFKSGPISQI
jgi:hypothetical protein